MTDKEIKKELENVIEGIPLADTEDELNNYSELIKKLYSENYVPQELDDMFCESDVGAMFFRITGRGIME